MSRVKTGGAAALTLAVAVVLAGCGGTPPSPAPGGAGPRDRSVQIYAMAGLTPARLVGQWREVAGMGGCSGGGLAIAGTARGLQLDGALCDSGRLQRVSGPVQLSANGRLQGPGLAEDLIAIWADYDNRTLVLATPSGRVASVLDRSAISADRLTAARQMLSYNGYPAAQVK